MIDKDKRFTASITVSAPQAIEVKHTRGESLQIIMRGTDNAQDTEDGLRAFIGTLVTQLDSP